MVCVSRRKVSELLRQSEAVPHVLRGHKVFRHLDTAVQIVYLIGTQQKESEEEEESYVTEGDTPQTVNCYKKL